MTEQEKHLAFLEREVANLQKRVTNLEKELAWIVFNEDQQDAVDSYVQILPETISRGQFP